MSTPTPKTQQHATTNASSSEISVLIKTNADAAADTTLSDAERNLAAGRVMALVEEYEQTRRAEAAHNTTVV